ncbi:hypothetical protein VTU32_06585 [Thermoanaerobacter sp. CM-CNRG TB177]|uniref:hypothetical protein n=1 Tax=Thermoanaerobacter sp. CM-CNRG TB177 TaxID=2800659 RepID=UPI001BDE8C7A|nr:hypothetical protein [Thermoanaerobacter sp. CM-CNRG TB177]MBT1278963.1 hypothetical protein [Thermoanaerobacter sp. CM-CNRG TB177]
MYNEPTFNIYRKVMTVLTNLKKDRKGLNEYVAVASLLALVAGIAVLAIPNARTTVSDLWNDALGNISMLNPFTGSTNNQTPVSGSNSTAEPITNPVQPPVSDTTTPSPSTGTQPLQDTSIIDPAQGKQPITGVETGSGTTIGNPVTNPVQPPVSDGTSSTTSPSTTPFVPTPIGSGTPVRGIGSTTEPITKPVQPPVAQ